MKMFATLVGRYLDRQITYAEHNALYYKEYSNVPITGNDDLIGEIKNRVLNFTAKINDELKRFEDELISFHKTTFEPKIKQLIQSEIDKRNLNYSSAAKLNPFA